MQLTIDRTKANTKLPQVVRAAIDLFVEKGVDGTTIRDIAERAGVSEGALYRHFTSKEELACSIFVTHLQQITEELATAIASAPDYRSKVRAFVGTCLDAYEEDPKLFTYLIVSEYREFQSLPEGTRHPGNLAMEMLAAGQAAGVLRPLEIHVAGSILVGSLVRICAAKMYGGVDDDLRTLAAGMADSLWDALKKN
jgi:AcrR family transcriptional regulator